MNMPLAEEAENNAHTCFSHTVSGIRGKKNSVVYQGVKIDLCNRRPASFK